MYFNEFIEIKKIADLSIRIMPYFWKNEIQKVLNI
jgi:hypothetical protein